jgi:3-oxoacyl-(acyl-carrier-protein) synthase
LAGAADELNHYQLAAGCRWRWWNEDSVASRPFNLNTSGGPLAGEGAATFLLAPDWKHPGCLAKLVCTGLGRVAQLASGGVDTQGEAKWVEDNLRRSGIAPADVSLLLTGANGRAATDHVYVEIARELSKLGGREVPVGAYKQCCGEFASASAIGLAVAVSLVHGDINPLLCLPCSAAGSFLQRPATVVLYTLGRGGTKAMSCVQA